MLRTHYLRSYYRSRAIFSLLYTKMAQPLEQMDFMYLIRTPIASRPANLRLYTKRFKLDMSNRHFLRSD